METHISLLVLPGVMAEKPSNVERLKTEVKGLITPQQVSEKADSLEAKMQNGLAGVALQAIRVFKWGMKHPILSIGLLAGGYLAYHNRDVFPRMYHKLTDYGPAVQAYELSTNQFRPRADYLGATYRLESPPDARNECNGEKGLMLTVESDGKKTQYVDCNPGDGKLEKKIVSYPNGRREVIDGSNPSELVSATFEYKKDLEKFLAAR